MLLSTGRNADSPGNNSLFGTVRNRLGPFGFRFGSVLADSTKSRALERSGRLSPRRQQIPASDQVERDGHTWPIIATTALVALSVAWTVPTAHRVRQPVELRSLARLSVSDPYDTRAWPAWPALDEPDPI